MNPATPTTRRLVVLIAGDGPAFRESVGAALGRDLGIEPVLADLGLGALQSFDGNPPDVVLTREGDGQQLDGIEHFTQRFAGIPLLLVCAKKDPDLMMRALHAGVKEFVFEPLETDELIRAVRRLAAMRSVAAGQFAHVMAFVPCKGGSGATFLATNIAHVLAAEKHKRVLVVDLNLQFGDAYLFLMDQVPAVTLADVCQAIGRLDPAFLESATAKLASGVHLLAAPASPEDGEIVKPEHVGAIVTLARSAYDFIVLDVGRNFDAVALKALDMADQVYAVLQLDLPYVRQAKRMKDVFRNLGYGPGKVRWVVNRYVGKEEIPLADASRLLSEAYWTVPNDHRNVVASVNQGIPMAQIDRHSPVTKSLMDWANKLVPEPVGRRGLFSWMHRSGPRSG